MNQYQVAFGQTSEQWNVDAENGFLEPFRTKAMGTRLSPINWYQRYWLDRMLYEGSAGGEVYPNWKVAPQEAQPTMICRQTVGGGTITLYVDVPDIYPDEAWGYALSVEWTPTDTINYYYAPPGGSIFSIATIEVSTISVGWSVLRFGWLKSNRNFVDVTVLPA